MHLSRSKWLVITQQGSMNHQKAWETRAWDTWARLPLVLRPLHGFETNHAGYCIASKEPQRKRKAVLHCNASSLRFPNAIQSIQYSLVLSRVVALVQRTVTRSPDSF